MDCMQFHTYSSKPIDCHEHDHGTETFIVTQGKILANCMGRNFIMEPGDILHIQPWMGHGFKAAEPESRLNILFMGIEQEKITEEWQRMLRDYPGVYENMKAVKKYNNFNGHGSNRSLPASDEIWTEGIQQLRRKGQYIREHIFGGLKIGLVVAKYETHGIKEIWQHFWKKGVKISWEDFVQEYHLFYVTSGTFHVKIKTTNTEVFEFNAVPENLIVMPPYTPFSIEAAEDSVMYDLDCAARLEDLCEEIESLKRFSPEVVKGKDEILKLAKEFGLTITDYIL